MVREITYTRPFLYSYQKEILDCPARYTITIACTKAGKTASHIIWLFEEALKCKANQTVWWVAPTFSQAKIAYSRMKVQISDQDFFTANETNLIITLITGVKIQFKTAEKPDNLFGDDIYAIVFDEFTRAREEAWFALRSTLTSTGGKCKFIGNAKGKKNWGVQLAMRAKAGKEENYHYFKVTAYDVAAAGMKTKDGRPFIEEVEQARMDMPEHAFNEMYMAEASDDGSNPFGMKHIAACCVPEMSNQEAICYGIDVARKVDWMSIIGLDKLAHISHYDTFTKTDWNTAIARVNYLPNKPMAMDSTGVGDVVHSQVSVVHPDVEAYIFTEKSKQMLMEGLAVGIQQRKLTIPDDGNVKTGTGRIRHQLEQFQFVSTRTGIKYSAPDGDHDDDVCALALAWHKYQTAKSFGEISVW